MRAISSLAVALCCCCVASADALPGDANGDWRIGIEDLAIVGLNWGRTDVTGGASEGDFDESGTVDLSDLGVFATSWGGGPPIGPVEPTPGGLLVNSQLGFATTSPVSVGDGLVGFDLTLVSREPGNKPRWAWGWHGEILGQMNQIQAFDGLDTPTLTNASFLPDAQQAQDTHFQQLDAQLLSWLAPNEEVGSLAAMFALPNGAASQGPRSSLLHIVIPEGEQLQLKALVADGTGSAYYVECTLPFLVGDANHDDDVDLSDLGILAEHWGTTDPTSWEVADFNDDGLVNLSDLGMLASHYGTSVAAVPEPGTLTLLGLGAMAVLRRRGGQVPFSMEHARTRSRPEVR